MTRTPRYAAAITLSGAIALGAPPPALAGADEDPDAAPLQLTLTEAETRALEQSEQVRIAREDVFQAESQITQARAGAFPELTGSIRYDRTLRSVFDIDGDGDDPGIPGLDPDELIGDLPFGQENAWNLSLQLNQPIYTGGRLTTGLELAEHVRDATHHGLDETEFETLRDVRQAYLQSLYTAALVDIAEEALEIADEQLELVETLRARGAATELDVLQARVERDNLHPDLVQAENAEKLAELELRRLLNVPLDRPIELADRPGERDIEADVARGRVIEAALDRPAAQAARESVRIQERNIELARAQRMPTVSAFANFSWQTFPDNIFPTSLPYADEWREDWIVGVQVNIPIFEGFRVTAEIDEAQSEQRVAMLEERQLREAITMEAEATLADLEAAQARIEARRGTAEEAERALELAELRFEQGMAQLIELSNARLMLSRALVNEAEAQIEYLSALAALEYVTGGELDLFAER